ncbi:hypothetical protein BRD02_00145 [Halobacteriales archaeon QS_8_69_73]|nr:MAG: hypothetical protein BRD02_00145 [Halobacteriales archaeon QS_8_69_73]
MLRASVLLWVVGFCLLAGVGGAVVVDASEHRADNRTAHQNPENLDDDGDLLAVQMRLADRLTEIHVDCAENLSVGETAVCSRLDGEYPEALERYADVERERTGETDTTETFEQARQNQSALANETEAFRETYEEYREAREAGDEERARELARELSLRAERIERLGERLDAAFLALESRTGRDYGEARAATNRTVGTVLETTREVRQAEFEPTELSVAVDAETASFDEPATVTGRLTDANGSALLGREVALRAGNRTAATAITDGDGRFEATYRPVTATTGPTTVEVVYEPTGGDTYLGTTATAEVTIESTRPSLSVETDASSVAFGDPVAAGATATVAGRPVPDAPVVVRLGEERIASGRTGPDGGIELEGPVPATVPDGERELAVRVGAAGTAIEPTVESRSVTVVETEPNLTVEGLLDGDELVVSGRLTANGRPVRTGVVGVSVDAEARNGAEPDAEGRYETSFPRTIGPAGVWSVTAEFNGSGTNLASTATVERLRADELERTNGTDAGVGGPLARLERLGSRVEATDDLTPRQLAALAGGATVAAVVLAAAPLLYTRRRGGEPELRPGNDELTPAFVRAADPEDDGRATPTPEAASGAFDAARARLEAGDPSTAVELGYGVVREELGDAVNPAAQTDTHWEFYRTIADELSDGHAAALERLTDAYERAAFAPDGADRGTARAALQAAAKCLDATAAADGGSSPGDAERGDDSGDAAGTD